MVKLGNIMSYTAFKETLSLAMDVTERVLSLTEGERCSEKDYQKYPEGGNLSKDTVVGKVVLPISYVLPCYYENSDLLAKVFDISEEDLRAVSFGKRFLKREQNADGSFTFSAVQMGDLDEKTEAYTGGEAVEWLFQSTDLPLLKAQLCEEMDAHVGRASHLKTVLRLEAVDMLERLSLDQHAVVASALPLPPFSMRLLFSKDASAWDDYLLHSRLQTILKRVSRVETFTQKEMPRIIVNNEKRLAALAIRDYFSLLEEGGITFSDPTVPTRILVREMAGSLSIAKADEGCRLRLPLRLRGDEAWVTLTVQGDGVHSYYVSDTESLTGFWEKRGIDCKRYVSALRRICDEKGLSFNGITFSCSVPGFCHADMMRRAFTDYWEGLVLLAHLDLFPVDGSSCEKS